MKKQIVKLNFLPLVNSSFKFIVFKRDYTEPKPKELYRARLPDNNDKDDWKDYLIDFTKFREGEEQIINSYLNPNITTKFIFYHIEKIVKKNFSKQILLSDKKFERKIYFILEKHTKGYETVWLSPYYLKYKNLFGFLVDFKFECHENISFNKDIQVLSLSLDKKFQSNKNFYIDKYKKVEEFLNKYFDKILEHLPCELKLSKKLEPIQSNFLSPKQYIFGNKKAHKSQFMGIQKFGPCSLPPGSLHIPVLYEEKMEYFASELLNGLKGIQFPTFNGFSKTFKIQEKFYKNKVELNINDKDFQKLIKKMSEFKHVIVPIIILESDEDQRYFNLKYFMVKNNLPFQVVTKKLISNKPTFKWSIANIALQIFAKSGGIPWKVTPSNENCFIFGLGQAHYFKEEKIIKYFSYSVCTDSSGIYKKIDILGKSDIENDYLNQLKDNIIKIIKQSKEEDVKKVVFHVPFRIRKNELDKIYEGLQSIQTVNNLDLIVIRVNSKNDFFGYASNNTLVPLESTFLPLSNKKYLIWFEGMQLHRENILHRIPGPILIDFLWSNRNLSMTEKKTYLQDLLNLSGTNWRGFNSKNLPISIYYCQLISEFLAKFQKDIYNIDSFPRPWFL